MPLSAAPRSVSDATRFTATTPHASSKAAAPPRFAAPRSGSGSAGSASAGGSGPGGSGGGGHAPGSIPLKETPEQKVARLRAAHRRAKEAQISRFDKIVDAGRRVFDSVHRVTVMGLVGFTGELVGAHSCVRRPGRCGGSSGSFASGTCAWLLT